MDFQDHYKSLQDAYNSMYGEGYKPLPKNKMQDKAAMKPDTARGEKQARKMDTVRRATDGNEGVVKKVVKGQEMSNRKQGLERKFNAPSADNAAEKSRKNKAYKLENQRRQDLNNRYGPKKESSHWLGQNGFSQEEMVSLNDAYASMYAPKEELDEKKSDSCWAGYKRTPGTKKFDKGSCVKEDPEEYAVSDENHEAIMEGKKKCKDGYYYCSDEKKCKKEKSKKSHTTVIVGGRYGYPGHDHDDDNDGDNNSGGDGGDGGGGGE